MQKKTKKLKLQTFEIRETKDQRVSVSVCLVSIWKM